MLVLLNRDVPLYHAVYAQRTACKRINSQAQALGIEQPKVRNGRSVRNLNTLTYMIINVRALQKAKSINTGLLQMHEFRPSTPAEPRTNGIIVLNFAQSLTMQQQTQIEELSNTTIENIITISTLINEEEPLEPQIASLIEAVDQSTHDWHKRDILINPPGYAPAAILLLAEIHGRIGHFPTLIRMRPKYASVTTYEVIQLLNLQTIRDAARKSSDTAITPAKHVKQTS